MQYPFLVLRSIYIASKFISEDSSLLVCPISRIHTASHVKETLSGDDSGTREQNYLRTC